MAEVIWKPISDFPENSGDGVLLWLPGQAYNKCQVGIRDPDNGKWYAVYTSNRRGIEWVNPSHFAQMPKGPAPFSPQGERG